MTEAHREKKTLLLLFGNLGDPENVAFFTELFDSEEVKAYLAKNYLIFGIENGTAEANHVSNEFAIIQVPHFATIFCQNDTEYTVIEEYKGDLNVG